MELALVSSELTAERLREVLHYNPETGEFTRLRTTSGARAGDVAGGTADGYIRIKVDYRKYRAHRLAVLYMTGAWPKDQVDHINRNTLVNRWANLREATHAQNMANKGLSRHNTSGMKGVRWNKYMRRWHAQIEINGKGRSLGGYNTAEAAQAAYMAAAREHYGEFARAA